jgi:hypothetical protein
LGTTVVAYFDVPTTPVFTLDDPVAGELDSVTYVLAGDIATDISADVVSVTTRRGRSRWLDEITVGTAAFVTENRDGDYNPTGGGLYSANIVPGKRVTISAGGTPIFDGLIDDWDLAFFLDGEARASAYVSDTLARLGRIQMDGHTTTSQLSGARVNAILDRPEVDFPAALRNVETGQTTLQADTVADGTDVLTYLQLVSQTEAGRLFAAADGVLTYQERDSAVSTTGVPEFRDDGSGIPYQDIAVTVGSDLLFNRAVVTREGGTTQIEDNTTSQALYDIRTLTRDGLLFNSDVDAESYAEYLVNKYATPEVRFNALTVSLAGLTTMQAATVCGIELGDPVRVVFTPPGGTQIDRYVLVEGIEHSIDTSNHRVTFRTSSLQEAGFTLDDAVLGVLDGDAVLSY